MVAQVSSESHKLSKSETPDRQIDRHTHTHTQTGTDTNNLCLAPLSLSSSGFHTPSAWVALTWRLGWRGCRAIGMSSC